MNEQDDEPKVHGNSKYNPEICELVTRLCLLGATDDEIAEHLEIARTTFYEWKKTYPEFADAIRFGKLEADALVAESLYRSAKSGLDTGASRFWLNNRRSQNWREKSETKVVIGAEQVFKIGDTEIKF